MSVEQSAKKIRSYKVERTFVLAYEASAIPDIISGDVFITTVSRKEGKSGPYFPFRLQNKSDEVQRRINKTIKVILPTATTLEQVGEYAFYKINLEKCDEDEVYALKKGINSILKTALPIIQATLPEFNCKSKEIFDKNEVFVNLPWSKSLNAPKPDIDRFNSMGQRIVLSLNFLGTERAFKKDKDDDRDKCFIYPTWTMDILPFEQLPSKKRVSDKPSSKKRKVEVEEETFPTEEDVKNICDKLGDSGSEEE